MIPDETCWGDWADQPTMELSRAEVAYVTELAQAAPQTAPNAQPLYSGSGETYCAPCVLAMRESFYDARLEPPRGEHALCKPHALRVGDLVLAFNGRGATTLLNRLSRFVERR